MNNSEKPFGSSQINDNMMVYFTMFGLSNSDLRRVFLLNRIYFFAEFYNVDSPFKKGGKYC